jgi:hypothetical protein
MNETRQERDEQGRFGKGNRGGPGNPFARQVARLRKAALEAVSDQDVQEIIGALKEKAKAGDVAAAKLVLSYSVGKPAPTHDPDRLDRHEFDTLVGNTVPDEQSVKQVLHLPLEMLLKILHAALPALREGQRAQLAEMLQAQPEKDNPDEGAQEEAVEEEPLEHVTPAFLQEILDRELGGLGSWGGHPDGNGRVAVGACDPSTNGRR